MPSFQKMQSQMISVNQSVQSIKVFFDEKWEFKCDTNILEDFSMIKEYEVSEKMQKDLFQYLLDELKQLFSKIGYLKFN